MVEKNSKRVVVTGMGVTSAIGMNLPAFLQGLFGGACGIREISLFDTAGYLCKFAAQVPDSSLNRRFNPKEVKRTSRCDLLGLMAAKEALAGYPDIQDPVPENRIGVVMGGGAGGMFSWEKYRKTLVAEQTRPMPSLVLASSPCTLTDLIANQHGFKGIRTTITTACSSSANAIGYAYDLIHNDTLDMAVTGGSESLSELTFAGFHSLKVMSSEPCRPFDRRRKGLSLGEGAGVLILEDAAHAEKRSAHIYAEILGYALNADAYHMTSPHPEGRGMIQVMARALKHAGLRSKQVDYINAHGTATKINDRVEARAIRNVFGARGSNALYVSSTKSMVGHCLGASGAIEAIATIAALDRQEIPPTVHLDEPDPECALLHVANTSLRRPLRIALSNSFAFGGNNTTLVFGRWR